MITTNSPRGDRPLEVPAHTDGTPYRFELIHSDGAKRTYADTLTELIDGLIPGYAGVDQATADELRLRYMVDVQVQLQAHLATSEDLATCTAEQRELILGPRHRPPELTTAWQAPVPLVLIDSFYEPLGALARPEGKIVWLSPIDEAGFLTSLAEAGVVTLSEYTG